MHFNFGCAKSLYEQHIHPRVVLGPGDLATLRRKTRAGDGRKILAGLRQKCRPILERIQAARAQPGGLAEALVKPDHLLAWSVTDLALLGLLDEDTEMMDAARQTLVALAEVPAGKMPVGEKVFSMCYGCHPWAFDLLHAQFHEEERVSYRRWIVEQCIRPALVAARPAYYKAAGQNTIICYTLPCLTGLLAILGDPGVPDLTAELNELVQMLEASLHCAINPDGYPEEDVGYGTHVGALLAQIAEPLRRAGIYDPYAACPRYARFGDAILHFIQPWGQDLSNTGDHCDGMGWREMALACQARETRNPALLWLLGAFSDGIHCAPKTSVQNPPMSVEVPLRKGFQVPASAASLLMMDQFPKARHPARVRTPTFFRDRGRGIVSFRSGWDADATFVVFDGSQRSPAGQGHFHASCGHFSISAFGECFAIASGRYNMEQNCHNVVLIDGKSGRSTDGQWCMTYWDGNLTDYQPGKFVDFASVDSSRQHNCYWARRHLGLVKGVGAPAYVWTVDDINKANDHAEFWWQLHTSPENVIKLSETSATIQGWRHGNLLDVHFALPMPEAFPKPHILALAQDVVGPSSYQYIPNPQERAAQYERPSDMLHYSAFVRPRLLAKVGGYNGRFMSVMLPRKKNATAPEVTRLPSLDNSLALRIRWEKTEDTLIYACEHNLLEAGGVKARGQWCVVRQARKTGRVLACELGCGTSLAVDGKVLVRRNLPAARSGAGCRSG